MLGTTDFQSMHRTTRYWARHAALIRDRAAPIELGMPVPPVLYGAAASTIPAPVAPKFAGAGARAGACGRVRECRERARLPLRRGDRHHGEPRRRHSSRR
jgi:hypothetical protein